MRRLIRIGVAFGITVNFVISVLSHFCLITHGRSGLRGVPLYKGCYRGDLATERRIYCLSAVYWRSTKVPLSVRGPSINDSTGYFYVHPRL